MQKTLNSLDPLGRFGAVKRELFADVFSMETPFLCEAFVRGFRHAPKEAFCDAVLLARGFEAEAQTVSLNTRGVVDPLGVDQLQLQSVRVPHLLARRTVIRDQQISSARAILMPRDRKQPLGK